MNFLKIKEKLKEKSHSFLFFLVLFLSFWIFPAILQISGVIDFRQPLLAICSKNMFIVWIFGIYCLAFGSVFLFFLIAELLSLIPNENNEIAENNFFAVYLTVMLSITTVGMFFLFVSLMSYCH